MLLLKTSEYDYDLPQELIAQTPIEPRDHSRLLVLDRGKGTLSHRQFYELPEYLKSGDVLIFNNSRVIRARLFGNRMDTGKKIRFAFVKRKRKNK